MPDVMHNKPRFRLLIAAPLPAAGTVELMGDQAHYLSRVMRADVGEKVLLFNGVDGEWLAEVATLAKRNVTLAILKRTREQVPEPDLWLVFAPIKKVRVDFLAQKATELGVSRLVPVLTHRTNVERVKVERFAANAREAAEQCERLTVPTVAEPQKLETLLDNWPVDRHLIFCDEDQTGDALLAALDGRRGEPAAILIGPEGGFDDAERARIRAIDQAIPVSLGPRILRADTAALAAITLFQAVAGDW